jgi:hypothetical protein
VDANGSSWKGRTAYPLRTQEGWGPGSAEGRMTAIAACRTCGTEPREGARYCDACGSLIAPATEHAKYKQVTVLFSDVVHSMDIAATVCRPY